MEFIHEKGKIKNDMLTVVIFVNLPNLAQFPNVRPKTHYLQEKCFTYDEAFPFGVHMSFWVLYNDRFYSQSYLF